MRKQLLAGADFLLGKDRLNFNLEFLQNGRINEFLQNAIFQLSAT